MVFNETPTTKGVAMESNESPKPPVKKSCGSRMTGTQKVVIGCFGIWCATVVANQFIGYKTLNTRLALETLKATTES
jgi:hypothetical protein